VALTMRTALAVHAVALLALAASVAAHSPASAHVSDGATWQLQQQEDRWRLEGEEDTYKAGRKLQQLPSGAAGGPAAAVAQPPGSSAGAAMAMAPAAAASPAVAAALEPGQDLPPGSECALTAGTDHKKAASTMLFVSCADALHVTWYVADEPPVDCRLTEAFFAWRCSSGQHGDSRDPAPWGAAQRDDGLLPVLQIQGELALL
jgi:hypothetical protein